MTFFAVLSFRTPRSAENLKIFSINSWKSAQCMFYIRFMYVCRTTFLMFPNKDNDCFLVCFVQNIRHLVGTSDVTTISNDRGNILQTSCKTLLKKQNKNEYCCVVQMHGSEHTGRFQWFRSNAVVFWLFKVFSLNYNTSHLTNIRDQLINWSKIQLLWVSYPYKTMFSAYKSVIVSPCACDLFVSKVTKITRYMDVWRFNFGGHFQFGAFFSVWWLYLEINQSLVAEISCTIYSFIHASTQHNISNKNSFQQCLFSSEVYNPLHHACSPFGTKSIMLKVITSHQNSVSNSHFIPEKRVHIVTSLVGVRGWYPMMVMAVKEARWIAYLVSPNAENGTPKTEQVAGKMAGNTSNDE